MVMARPTFVQNSMASFALVMPPNLDILMLTTSAAWSCHALTRLLAKHFFQSYETMKNYIQFFSSTLGLIYIDISTFTSVCPYGGVQHPSRLTLQFLQLDHNCQ